MVFNNILNLFERFVSKRVDARHVGIFRILYAAVTLTVAITTVKFLELKYYGSSESLINGLYVLNLVWFLALICILIGRFVSISALYTCIVTPILFDTTIGSNLIQIGAFWMIFLSAGNALALGKANDDESAADCPAWPLFLLALNVAILDFFSGMAKLYDPHWVNGTGFYYSFLEPWLRSGDFPGVLLDSYPTMVAFNYLAIIIQLIGLPLLFFKKTRGHAILSIGLQFMLLTYPIRIDPIGPIGLVLCFGMYAIVTRDYIGKTLNTRLIPFLSRHLETINAWFSNSVKWKGVRLDEKKVLTHTPAAKMLTLGFQKVFVFGLIVFMGLMSLVYFVQGMDKIYIKYPVIQFPLVTETGQPIEIVEGDDFIHHYIGYVDSFSDAMRASPLPFISSLIPNDLMRILKGINSRTVTIKWWAPFTNKHFIGRYGYYIRFYNENGDYKEPIRVNFPSGERGDFESGLLKNSVMQNRTWLVTQVAHKVSLQPSYRLQENEEQTIAGIINWLYQRDAEELQNYGKAVLILTPYLKPTEYVGDFSREREDESLSIPFIEYDIENETLKIIDKPPVFTFPLKFPEFGNEPPLLKYSY